MFFIDNNNNNTYACHLDSTPGGANKTSTKDKEGSVDEELISGTTKEQELVAGSLIQQLSMVETAIE